ncbi:MAG: hypothetical protein ACRC3Z_09650 [Phocaeicola sp.]
MCVIKTLTNFVRNSGEVFRSSARGEYYRESAEVTQMRKELFEKDSSKRADRVNLKKDSKKIAGDVRRAINKIELAHG